MFTNIFFEKYKDEPPYPTPPQKKKKKSKTNKVVCLRYFGFLFSSRFKSKDNSVLEKKNKTANVAVWRLVKDANDAQCDANYSFIAAAWLHLARWRWVGRAKQT